MLISLSSILLTLVVGISPVVAVRIADVERNLNIKNNYLEISTTFSVKNDKKTPLTFFNFHFDPVMKQNLSYIQAKIDGSSTPLKIEKKDIFVVILLDAPLSSGASLKIKATEVYTHIMTPFPSHVSQFETQLVVLRFNNYLYSEYTVESQRITVTLPDDSTVKSYDGAEPKKQTGTKIKFGAYESVLSFTNLTARVHFSNQLSFIVITHHDRVHMVSEWGQVRVDETLYVFHEGAVLTGSFDRLQFSMNPTAAAVTSFNMLLPSSASRITYKDEIGNISTSDVYFQSKYKRLRLIPRFPIFGGWNGHYTVGYVYPVSESLRYQDKKPSVRIFSTSLIGQPMESYVIDTLSVSVVIPDHSKLVGVYIDGKAVKDYEISKTYSYLDIFGRTTVIIHRKNVVNKHNDKLEVHYEYDSKMLILKPLYLGSIIFIALFLSSMLSRIDLSLEKNDSQNLAALVSHLLSQIRKTEASMQKYLKTIGSEIETYKKSMDKDKIRTSHITFNSLYSKSRDQLLKLVSELKGKRKISPEVHKQLSSLSEKLSARLNFTAKQVELVISAAEKTISRDKYTEQNKKLETDIESASDVIESLISLL